jgi:hypothetical protein
MPAGDALQPYKTGVGLKEAGLVVSAMAGAIVASFLICQLFIFAAEAGGAMRHVPALDESNLCNSPDGASRLARRGS